MTQHEYEQKKRECWEEAVLHGALEVDKDLLFDHAFKCGYALGKQAEAITREEIEKVAKRFADEIRIPASIPGVMVPFINGLAHDAYLHGAQDSLGKQEKDADTVIQGWVARDMDGRLYVYCHEPKRNLMECLWEGEIMNISLSDDMFPDLTWESEPIEVEIQIKRKKNG